MPQTPNEVFEEFAAQVFPKVHKLSRQYADLKMTMLSGMFVVDGLHRGNAMTSKFSREIETELTKYKQNYS